MSLFKKAAKPRNASDLPDILADAIALVPVIDAFFGHFMAGVKFERRDNLGSVMATNCFDKIFYDPAEFAKPPFDNASFLACVIVHELCHIWRMDGFFCRGKNPLLANIATDAIINRDMLAGGYRFPGNKHAGGFQVPDAAVAGGRGFIASNDDTETTDYIYERIEALAKQMQQQPDASKSGANDMLQEEFEKAVKAAGGDKAAQSKIERRVILADNAAQDEKNEADKAAENGEKPDKPAPGKKEQSQKHAAIGHGSAESVSDGALSWYGLKPAPRKNPLANIVGSSVRATMTSRAKRGRSMLRPSYLSDFVGYVRAGRAPMPDVRPAVAFDISGSISPDMLVRFGHEAKQWSGSIKEKGVRIEAAFFNTRIVESGSLNKYRDSNAIPKPCGGTSFIPVFEWVKSLPARPSHVLVWTDCMGDFPETVMKGTTFIFVVPREFKQYESHDYYKTYFEKARRHGKIVYSV
jgi:hypothetical protein